MCKKLPESKSHPIPLNHHLPMVFRFFHSNGDSLCNRWHLLPRLGTFHAGGRLGELIDFPTTSERGDLDLAFIRVSRFFARTTNAEILWKIDTEENNSEVATSSSALCC